MNLSVTVKSLDNSILLTAHKKPNGMYDCPCDIHQGQKSFNHQDMIKHFEHLQEEQIQPIRNISHQLSDTPVLQSLGLAVNHYMKILICLQCKIAVLPSHIESHLHQKHNISSTSYNRNQLTSSCRQFELLNTFSTDISPETIQVEGLDLAEALACNMCSYFCLNESSMKKHCKKRHQGQVPPSKWATAFVQQFNNGTKSWFQVQKRNAMSTTSSIMKQHIASYQRHIECLIQNNCVQPDIRNVTPWLRATKWHQEIQGYDVLELQNYIAIPSDHEFGCLRDALILTLDQAIPMFEKTSILIRQHLNSPDPEKNGISNSPFSKHQNHEFRMKKYMTPILHLLAMLLRSPISYKITLPANFQLLVQKLKIALQKGNMKRAANNIYCILHSLWTQQWIPTETAAIPDPTIQALLLLSIKRDGSFMQPQDLTPIIAQLEYCMRLIFLISIGLSDDASESAINLRPWHTEKVESTFNSLRTLQHMLSAIAYSTVSLPRIWWTDKNTYTTLLYRGDPIDFKSFPIMFQSMEQDMVNIWKNEILCGLDLHIAYNDIFEDLSNKSIGYSFMTDTRNSCFQDKTILSMAIINNEGLRSRFIIFCNDTMIKWNILELRKWLASYTALQLLFLARSNMTTGSASRGTELTGMTRSNTASNPIRNLVMFDKYVTLLCTYQKTSALSGNDKCIPHALDGFTSDLILQDLAISRPFAEMVAYLCYPTSLNVVQLYRSHIFVNNNRLFTTDDLTAILETITIKHLHTKLGTNAWRHVSTAFRRKLCSHMEDIIEQDEMDSVQAIQSGHSRQTENRVYALSPDSFSGVSEDLLPLFLEASTEWQKVIGVVPGGCGLSYNKALVSNVSAISSNQVATSKEQKIDILSNQVHTLSNQVADLTATIQDLKNLIYLKTHNQQYPDQTKAHGLQDMPQFTDKVLEKKMLLSQNYSVQGTSPTVSLEASALKILKKLLQDENAHWTSAQQRDGVLASIRLEKDILAIMATGSGKTMLAIIPAMMNLNQITVVVLPLKSLMLDYKRRLHKMDVPYEEYCGSPLSSKTNIVLVSADTAQNHNWKEHITILNERKKVVRHFFDEAQIPLTSQDFRPSMQNLFQLRILPSQMILSSGTVTRAAEAVLIQEFELDAPLILRSKTNRPELEYIWMAPVASKDLAIKVKDLLSLHSPQDSKGRVLIFVSFLETGTHLSSYLKAPFYNGSMFTTDNQRLEMYNSWISGVTRILICTNAFGAGNDYSHTRLVIHAGTPMEMVNYIQEVSRGGRDKQPARCFLLPTFLRVPSIHETDLDLGGKNAMYKALTGPSRCIRALITEYADGSETVCSDSNQNRRCSVCVSPKASNKRPAMENFEQPMERAKLRRVNNELSTMNYIANFKTQLDRFSHSCIICLIHDLHMANHNILLCPTLQNFSNGSGVQRFKAFKAKLKYGPHHKKICYKCHLPQGDGDAIHSQFVSGLSACPAPDLLLPIAFAFYHMEIIQDKHKLLHESYPTEDQFFKWLNGVPEKGYESNLIYLFLLYAESRYQTDS